MERNFQKRKTGRGQEEEDVGRKKKMCGYEEDRCEITLIFSIKGIMVI